MIHRKLHSLRCGTRDITFICYGPCKAPPLGNPCARGYDVMQQTVIGDLLEICIISVAI